MPEIKDGFLRMYHKKNKVWAALTADGASLLEHDGRVKIKYQLSQTHEYLVPVKSLRPLEEGPDPNATAGAHGKSTKAKKESASVTQSIGMTVTGPDDIPENAILMYTDGASSGNPGPSGIGVLLQHCENRKEISEYIGFGTNNIAELKAVERGLLSIKNKKLPVRILTDSQYVLGLLSLNWKAQKNQEIVADIKKLMREFSDLKLIKVKGHQGNAGNETADRLAVAAIKNAPKD